MSKFLDKDHPLHILAPKGGARRIPFTEEMQEAWLQAYARYGTKTKACTLTNITLHTVKRMEKENPEFAEAMEMAREIHTDLLEAKAIERAEGIEETVYYQGNEVGTRTVASDRLMELFLKARRPKVYNDRLQLDVAPEGGVLVVGAIPTTTKAWLESTEDPPPELPGAPATDDDTTD